MNKYGKAIYQRDDLKIQKKPARKKTGVCLADTIQKAISPFFDKFFPGRAFEEVLQSGYAFRPTIMEYLPVKRVVGNAQLSTLISV